MKIVIFFFFRSCVLFGVRADRFGVANHENQCARKITSQAETWSRQSKAETIHSVCILQLLAFHSLRMCSSTFARSEAIHAFFAANCFLTDRIAEYNYVTLTVDVPCALVALKSPANFLIELCEGSGV